VVAGEALRTLEENLDGRGEELGVVGPGLGA
jgi:hypothetical protein